MDAAPFAAIRTKEAEMSDDIETLRRLADHLGTEERKDAIAALERVEKELSFVSREANRLANDLRNMKADRDSLRKTLDDRWAADLKAAKAIFAETGRTSGFPSVREVVAWYAAEVERLETMLRDERVIALRNEAQLNNLKHELVELSTPSSKELP